MMDYQRMTVGQLKERLEGHEDSEEVVLQANGKDYPLIALLLVPVMGGRDAYVKGYRLYLGGKQEDGK